MIVFGDISNQEIDDLIMGLYKTTKNRAILRERVFGGKKYDEIIEKYFGLCGPIEYSRRRRKIRAMEDKLKKAINETCETKRIIKMLYEMCEEQKVAIQKHIDDEWLKEDEG